MSVTRSSGPTQDHAFDRGPRITAIETLVPKQVMPGLMLLRIHTDAGSMNGVDCIGHGETYYIPEAAAAVIHDWMAQRLLGADAIAIESHWRFLHERATAFGGVGAELRALSAIDLALWDILGQLCGQPVWRLLGGPVRNAVPVYNSCGGPFYGVHPGGVHPGGVHPGGVHPGSGGRPSWPGHGDPGKQGPLEDNWASMNSAGELAEELLDAGFRAMKIWAFDAIYRESGGLRVSSADLQRGTAPFREIRDRVGDRIDVMLDGHGFFALPAAISIGKAMREFQPLWLEDVLRPDSVPAMIEFRRMADVPIAVSEMLVTREQYRQVLDGQAADYVMIDPTWVGGISESRRIAELAQLANVPVLMHDCTGPLTLFAGLNVAAAVPGVTYQECVRAHLATLYQHLIDVEVTVTDGSIRLSDRPGIGARWQERLFTEQLGDYRKTSE